MQIHALVLAGGDGNRFGGELPKQFVRLAGEEILLRTLRRLGSVRMDRIVVVADGEVRDYDGGWSANADRVMAVTPA